MDVVLVAQVACQLRTLERSRVACWYCLMPVLLMTVPVPAQESKGRSACRHAARQAEALRGHWQRPRQKNRPSGDAPTATWSYLGNTQP